MSFAKVYSAQTSLLKAHIIDVEVDLSKGLHNFALVGLPDKAVEESRDRVSAAIKNSGFKSPKNKNQKVVVSLAPADLKKEGPIFDLAIALAYLLASNDIKFDAHKKIFLGELSLDGELRKINGVLPLVEMAKRAGFDEIFLPAENANEAALIGKIDIFPVKNLIEVIEHLNIKRDEDAPRSEVKKIEVQPRTKIKSSDHQTINDFADIKGQEAAKRGLEIAAAGNHNIALYGPPGTGKTMLAKAFSGILPSLSFDEILEVTSIHSVAGLLTQDLITKRPVRSPHHTSSYVSLVGGGAVPKPGEITLAHRGVLFLDEFPEFEKRVLETLRQPLEDRIISISRAKGSAHFPAHFILIAAMNPCPCGNMGIKNKECVCSPSNIMRYQRKLSGPIIDRIDLWIEVPQVEHKRLSNSEDRTEPTFSIKKRVEKARKLQEKRFRKSDRKIKTNSEMGAKDILSFVPLKEEVKNILNEAARKLDLSARGYHKIIKLARTIADLEGGDEVKDRHILEALQYRPKSLLS